LENGIELGPNGTNNKTSIEVH